MSAATNPSATPHTPIDTAGYDGPTDIGQQIKMAEFLAKAVATLPVVYRDRPSDIFAVVLQARALNIPVMTAIHNLIWDEKIGKGAMSAQLMGALLLRGGVVYTPEFVPTKMCSMTFARPGRPGGRCEWSITEAIGAGIANSYTWKYYPDDMLFARCLSRGARRFAPDLILGFGYTIDELREMTTDEPVDNDRQPDADVVEFLAQVTDDTPAAKIQELSKEAGSKRVNLAGKYAGNGQTVTERLHSLWLAATGREMDKMLAASDRAMNAEPPPAPVLVVPGDAAGSAAVKPDVRDAPAGEGNADCGCPTARLIAGQGHDPAVHNTKGAPDA